MSAGGNDGLFKLAENAAPDENRLMPAERTYPKGVGAVSLEEAVALMKQRKKDPSLRIKGGIDDTSDAVRKNKPKLTPESMKLVDPVFDATDATAKPIAPVGITDEGMVGLGHPSRRRRKPKEFDDLVAKVLANIDTRMTVLQKSLAATAAPGKTAAKEDKLSTFKSGVHKVTFMLDGMEFSVKCLSMIKDTAAHTVVFVFDDSGETFFTPQMKSELKVKYDGVEDPGTLYYFGMSFSMDALGLRFLGFIYSDQEDGK